MKTNNQEYVNKILSLSHWDYIKEQKKEMNTRNLIKRNMRVADIESEWNKFLQEWVGYKPDLEKIIPPIAQIRPLVEHIVKENIIYEKEIQKRHLPLSDRRPKILGYGQSGIVIQKIYDDWPTNRWSQFLIHCKLGNKLNREYDLLKRIKDNKKGSTPKHFPYLREDKCIWHDKHIVGLIMENDSGLTLDNYAGWGRFKQHNKPGYYWVNRVGYYLLDALKEMDNAGIKYHRDIRPENILIPTGYDEIWGNVILLDLEYALRYGPNPGRFNGNRRFGGPNDLVSVGQVLYYLATGESIFASVKGKDRFLRDIPDNIKYNRDKAYRIEGNIDEIYLNKVNKKIPYKDLAMTINACLTARHDDVERIHELFQKVSV